MWWSLSAKVSLLYPDLGDAGAVRGGGTKSRTTSIKGNMGAEGVEATIEQSTGARLACLGGVTCPNRLRRLRRRLTFFTSFPGLGSFIGDDASLFLVEGGLDILVVFRWIARPFECLRFILCRLVNNQHVLSSCPDNAKAACEREMMRSSRTGVGTRCVTRVYPYSSGLDTALPVPSIWLCS